MSYIIHKSKDILELRDGMADFETRLLFLENLHTFRECSKENKMDELLLTDEEIDKAMEYAIDWAQDYTTRNGKPDSIPERQVAKAQLAKVFTRFKEALEQSRKGEPIDLPEEWFELFSAIQNSGIAKVNKHRLDRPEKEKILERIKAHFGSEGFVSQAHYEAHAGFLADQILALFGKEEMGGKADKLIGGFAEGKYE